MRNYVASLASNDSRNFAWDYCSAIRRRSLKFPVQWVWVTLSSDLRQPLFLFALCEYKGKGQYSIAIV